MPGDSPHIAFMTASDADRTPFASAIALLNDAAVSWACIESPDAIADAAVVICLARPTPDLAIRCARTTIAPVLTVPWPDALPTSHDLLLNTLNFPSELGISVLAIGEPGMKNAALSAISILALHDPRLAAWWSRFREEQTESVLVERDLP